MYFRIKEPSIWVLQILQNQRAVNLGSSNTSESKNRQFGFFKYFRIKEPSIWVLQILQNQRTLNFGFLKSIQNQRIVSSNCFKNLKELMVFMKELSNNCHSLASSSKNFENYTYIPKPAIWQFWKLAGKWICTRVGNRCISVPHCKHHLPLVVSKSLPFMHGG